MESIASFSGLASGIQWRDMIDQIMKLETTRRVTPVTDRIKLQQQRRSAWGDYNSLVTKFRDAAKSFSDGTAFGVFQTTASNSPVSGRALVSATASSQATPGSYNLEVLQLASAEKLGSAEVANATASLNLSGTFFVNGRPVSLESGDSLSALRDKINAANTGSDASGVTATILSTSSNSHRLILTAANTGSRGIELVDDSTSPVLQSAQLGILTGTQSANASTVEAGWTDSMRFSSRSRVLMDVLGVTPPPAVAKIMVGGVAVEVDFSNDTLDEVLTKIQAADPNAKMREEVVGGRTMYRISTEQQVAVDPSSPASQQNLELLGFVKNGAASQITAGADARFQIDNYSLTRRSNTVSDAIQGVTFDLLATDANSRTLRVTGSDLAISRESKGIDAGTYAVALTGTGATIGGEAAVWDAATNTVRGATGSRFEGLELTYTGGATSGQIGELTVEGDISVNLKVSRDVDAGTKKVEDLVKLYNDMNEFVKRQRTSNGPLGSDGSLRSMMNSLRDVLLADVSGLSSSNPFQRLTTAGVEFTREGTLKVNSTTLKEALRSSHQDVSAFFAGISKSLYDTAHAIADPYQGSITQHRTALDSSISSLQLRQTDLESQLEQRRAGMVKQYTAMEEAISKIQNQGNWLNSQISALSGRPR